MGSRLCAVSAVFLAAVTAAAGSAAQVPSLPGAPSLPSAPSLPGAPALPGTPSLPSAPSLPQAPSAPSLPGSSVPTPQVPGAGGSPGSGGGLPGAGGGRLPGGGLPGGASSGAAGGGGAGSGARGAQADGPASEAEERAARKQAARKRAAAGRRWTRELRRSMPALGGCLGFATPFQRRVLILRSGLGPGPPLTRRATARRLERSSRSVARAEHAGLRRLRSARRTSGCGSGALAGARVGYAIAALFAAAGHSPQLLSSSLLRGESARDVQYVRRQSASSDRDGRGRGPAATAAGVPDEGVAGTGLDPLLVVAGALLAAFAGLVLRHRRPARADHVPPLGVDQDDEQR